MQEEGKKTLRERDILVSFEVGNKDFCFCVLRERDILCCGDSWLFGGHNALPSSLSLICILGHAALDEMGNRIDELEQSINDLRVEMGQEGSPSPSAALKSKDESKSAADSA
ncbi:hypothetical protein RND71_007914 [Anisodus tanguticus]|uniref:Uncharacterized protein n=1 Tax=Anisodus tanguticus TaxID=243964 RepID=A0AAE1SMR9_9SOLA|nr:hypothetical protein RND71_007914 [Anisodus tanguticus]